MFKAFPGKMVVAIFGAKGCVRKRAANKMISVFGVFQFDVFLSCVFG